MRFNEQLTPQDDKIEGHVNALPTDLPQLRNTTERKLMAKIDWHLMPCLCVMYLLAFLDRVNISNAAVLGLQEDLNIVNGTKYNTALTIFFVPYVIFEIPSNILLKKLRPHVWLTGCLITCVVSLAWFFVIPDFPEEVKWLTDEEREFLKAKLAKDSGSAGHDAKIGWREVLEVFKDYKIFIGGLMYFGQVVTAYGRADADASKPMARLYPVTKIKSYWAIWR
ncbi:hypothetical protein APSETT445_007865 [Aspergillus pseudonomiae]